MDLKQLRALVTVAEAGTVTRASALLNLVQPAVSRQLRLLEADLGAPLFERSRQGMALTAAGRALVPYARRALAELDRARAQIRPGPGAGTLGGLVTVGLPPSVAGLLGSPLVAALATAHPGIRLRLAEGSTERLQGWLERGEVDVALLADPRPASPLKIQPLLEEDLWVVGPPDCGLVSDLPVPLGTLAGRPLVLPSPPHGLRAQFEHAAAQAGLDLAVAAESNAAAGLKALVLGGHGWTLLPSGAVAEDLARGRLAGAPLVEPVLTRRIVLATPADREVPEPVRAGLVGLLECAREAVRHGTWRGARWVGEGGAPVDDSSEEPAFAD